jgi:hypothetical protein
MFAMGCAARCVNFCSVESCCTRCSCFTNEHASFCVQDGVLRGWFRTRPSPNLGAPHLRVIGLTALEIAVAMEHLHGQGILHGVSALHQC